MSDPAPAGGAAGRALVYCTDLIFGTKIAATARALGVEIEVIRSAAALAGRPAALILVDLDCDGALDAIERGRSASPAARIVAFGPHVEAALLADARRHGADEVLPRSAFTRRLGEILGALRSCS